MKLDLLELGIMREKLDIVVEKHKHDPDAHEWATAALLSTMKRLLDHLIAVAKEDS
jgi:hypothetical protein